MGFVLGPALVATLVLPATAVIIVVAGLLFASIDIWGATIFPHMWDQRTGQSYACTPYGWLTFFLAVPSALVVDGSFQFGAAGNQSLLRCGLDFLLLPLWTITTCVSALMYEYLGIGGAEIELLYTRRLHHRDGSSALQARPRTPGSHRQSDGLPNNVSPEARGGTRGARGTLMLTFQHTLRRLVR